MLTEYEKKIFKHRKIFIFLVFVIAAVYFWPASLYGDSDYILLFGESMLPTIQPGSLVIVKSQPSYDNGEIVAFVNSGGINIVHRIIEVTDVGYVTQGDNNSFKDAPIVDEDIKGKIALIIPYMAYVGLFMQTPIGLAMMAIMIIVMLLPKSKSKSKSISKLKTKSNGFVSIKITKLVKIGLVIIGIHYVIEQIAVAMNLVISNPLSGYFEPSFASTLTFAIWLFGFIAISLVSKKIEIQNSKGFNPMRITLFASIILIIMLHIITMIPTLVNIVSVNT
jgi:signal peptidase I